ncbi:hypothetical protein KHA96_05960 [Bacillus sp. FJAT-49711]|uniref:stalk domain-containing protein n=1 Tax=Bacillus sp. FJAT-49711 TaxID=2833585 RepID=UPI001BCA1FC9|nr:stalk domain-containing protein [Bacillus sp. FJAT-49711]MBS4217865.1 hypothetical protein [Bacillus sp. FJAT-49711]
MKRIIFFFVILICLVGGLLYYQWAGYSSQTDEIAKNIHQTIKLNMLKDKIQVEQTITGIKGKLYKVKVPEEAVNIKCISNKEHKCTIQSTNQVMLEHETVTFSFDLPFDKNVKRLLLQNYGVQLHNIVIDKTTVQLIDSVWLNANWISTSETMNVRKMDLVDYYVMKNKGKEPVLYWQREPLHITEVDKNLVIYSNSKINKEIYINKEQLPATGKKVHVLLTNQQEGLVKDNFLIINAKRSPREVKEKFTLAFIQSAYNFPENEQWLTNLISSFILNKPIGDSKSKKMYKEMNDKLSKEQLVQWKNKVLTSDKKISHKQLDQLLEEVTGYSTLFFTDNASTDEMLKPLVFLDSRDLIIKGSKVDGVKIVSENGNTMIDFVPLLKALQYEVNILENEILKADKGAINYRFYINKRIFELNGQRYGMTHAPVVVIENQPFIQLNLVNTLLNVQVTENNTQIVIN